MTDTSASVKAAANALRDLAVLAAVFPVLHGVADIPASAAPLLNVVSFPDVDPEEIVGFGTTVTETNAPRAAARRLILDAGSADGIDAALIRALQANALTLALPVTVEELHQRAARAANALRRVRASRGTERALHAAGMLR